MSIAFSPFPKMPRLSREAIITEKIDGTNASILITEGKGDPMAIHEWYDHETQSDMIMLAGSRTRWITPQADNHGFARWASENREALTGLGKGHHFGEWWGCGIQRGYGLKEKRFSLFNVQRWALHGTQPQAIPTADPRIVKTQDVLPPCCHLVPVLYRGIFSTERVDTELMWLFDAGSAAAPGFFKPEGVVVYHVAGNFGFKKTIEKDESPKGKEGA
jgi:hypothetical protein